MMIQYFGSDFQLQPDLAKIFLRIRGDRHFFFFFPASSRAILATNKIIEPFWLQTKTPKKNHRFNFPDSWRSTSRYIRSGTYIRSCHTIAILDTIRIPVGNRMQYGPFQTVANQLVEFIQVSIFINSGKYIFFIFIFLKNYYYYYFSNGVSQ